MSETNTAKERADAAKTAACYATDADDLRLILAVLGLDDSPTSPLCRKCAAPIGRLAAGGYNRAAGDGMCGQCFEGVKRAARNARKAAQ